MDQLEIQWELSGKGKGHENSGTATQQLDTWRFQTGLSDVFVTSIKRILKM